MPDLGPFVGALAELIGPLIGAFLRTTVGMFTLSGIMAFVAYRIAADSGSPWKSLLAIVLVLALGAVLGTVLAIKRAVLTALRHGVAKLKLGQRTLGALFAKILGLSGAAAEAQAGTRGGAIAQTVERLPLLRAEELLINAVSGLKKEGGVSGFFLSRLHQAIIDRVAAITLARFRAEGAQAGGVDLIKVRDELSVGIEDLLCGIFDKAMLKLTALIAIALCLGAILAAVAIKRL